MSLPAPYHGNDDESLRRFIFKLTNSTLITDTAKDSDKIRITSRLLEDSALDWFISLLKENAQQVISTNNAKRARTANGRRVAKTKLKNYDPRGWMEELFISDELRSWDAFIKALWVKFSDEDAEVESSRESSPEVQQPQQRQAVVIRKAIDVKPTARQSKHALSTVAMGPFSETPSDGSTEDD